MIDTVPSLPPPSQAALRMQRARERRRLGDVIVNLEVKSDAIADLVALGWLLGSDNGNKIAITHALIDVIERAIQAHITPSTSLQDQLCFMCTIRRSTIETLVSLGWLRAGDQEDLAAIVSAFRRFAGRAIDVARDGGAPRWYFP